MLMPMEEALAKILAVDLRREIERRPLRECLGLQTSEPVFARVTLPPDDASAMDGYAVRFEDVEHLGARLHVIGEAPAGHPFDGVVGERMAVRIFTGAKVPKGADHILIQEDAVRNDDTLEVTSQQKAPAHIRKAGIDFRAGEPLIGTEHILGPAELAVAAASDHAELAVYKPLKIGIISNGDELRLPGDETASGDIISSNPTALSALIRSWGGEPIDLGIAKDSPEAITALIQAGADCDVLVPVGGASVGDHDYMASAFAESGLDLIFRKVAVRPGKPTWFGQMRDQLVLGLPGNPASAYVCAHLFLKPLVDRAPIRYFTAQTDKPLTANGPREHFMRARMDADDTGTIRVTPMPRQDSSLLTPFMTANCLLRRASNAEAVEAGGVVSVTRLTSL